MDVEYTVVVSLSWQGPDATEDDCREAMKRCGLTHGALLGEFLIVDIEEPEEY